MSNSLAVLANRFVKETDNDVNPWTEAGADSGFFGTFLKFSGNDGKYSYGKKDEEEYLDDGHELVANLIGIEHGHICWVEGAVKDELNYLVFDRPKLPSIDDLPDYGPYKKYDDGSEDGWQEQVVLQLYSPELDLAFTAKLSGGGKLRAARQLISTYGKKGVGKLGKDGLPMMPVIELDKNGFKIKDNPKAGTKYAPVFKIIDWEEMSAFMDIFEGEGDDDEEGGKDDAANYADDKPARAAKKEVKEAASEKPARRAKAEKEEVEDDKPVRGSRRAKEEVEDAQVEDVTNEKADDDKPSRRARTVHAEPQDNEEDEAEETTSRRASARGRRGRTG